MTTTRISVLRAIFLAVTASLLLLATANAKHAHAAALTSGRWNGRWATGASTVDLSLLLRQRGGAAMDDEDEDEDSNIDGDIDGDGDSDDEYDDEEESEVDEDEEDLFDDFETDDDNADDFAENELGKVLRKGYEDTPPLTKMYLGASLLATTIGCFTNQNQFPTFLSLDWTLTLKKGQIWRPFTSFLNFGGVGLSYAMTMNFVWNYMCSLERLHHDKPYEFWTMFLFGMTSLLVGYPALKLSPTFLGHNLSTFFVYVWSKYNEGTMVNMFELVEIKAELLPWIFLAQTFLLEGEIPILDMIGIAFGHIYHHFQTTGLLTSPRFLATWYNNSAMAGWLRKEYKKVTADYQVI
eukprot:CAMPEP_0198116654 /NCGR_PEP_ID=MMETSP1442-20131203/13825_1 /TAXON_ID= /ORGANISM="Craspedostauros australis, Strain CCMP3328" /LENGTH=351 /DNA_ID=CAMNT_0043774529 /DNA_START=32 /DNA_END=1087 /DNA_ORIENTATION=+